MLLSTRQRSGEQHGTAADQDQRTREHCSRHAFMSGLAGQWGGVSCTSSKHVRRMVVACVWHQEREQSLGVNPREDSSRYYNGAAELPISPHTSNRRARTEREQPRKGGSLCAAICQNSEPCGEDVCVWWVKLRGTWRDLARVGHQEGSVVRGGLRAVYPLTRENTAPSGRIHESAGCTRAIFRSQMASEQGPCITWHGVSPTGLQLGREGPPHGWEDWPP